MLEGVMLLWFILTAPFPHICYVGHSLYTRISGLEVGLHPGDRLRRP